MASIIKVGQVWRDKDKRRDTTITILSVGEGSSEVLGLVVGTEEERLYKAERLVTRWTMVKEAPEPPKPKPTKKTNVSGKPFYQKVVCSETGGQIIRITTKQIELFGMPLCGCHKSRMTLA